MSEDTSLTPGQEEEEEIVERIVPEEEDNSPAPDRFDRVQPLFDLLKVDGVQPDYPALRDHFNRLWQYEKGDALPEDEQFLTTIGLFIYTAHLMLDDHNINTLRAREHINKALTEWRRPEIEKQVAAEKTSDNAFKAFVDQEVPRVDDYFSWRNFLLEHKRANEKGWDFKLRQCWFHRFFIRYGRVDFIETACEFDRIPWRAREDYVNLKLNNTFSKLGSFCQFKYSPKK